MALCWCALVIAFAVFLPFLTAAGFIDTPGNVTVHVGETAILQCSVDLINFQKSMIMNWYKLTTHSGLYVTVGESVRTKGIDAERYSLDTSNVGGVFTYNLRITNAEVGDSGQYQCRASDPDGTRRTEPGSLTVVQETNNETMSCSIYPEAPTLGQNVTFSCIAPRGISPDMLTWMDGTFQIIQPEANLTNEHGISFVKTLAEADNFAEFTCLDGSSFSTTRNGMNCSVTPLAVPIQAEVTPSVLNAVVAGNATFRCRGTAIPSVQKYRWLYGLGDSTIESNGRFSVVNNGDSSTLTITRLTAEDNSTMVRCVVQNAMTKTFDLAELHVSTTRMEFTSQQKTSPAAQTLEVSSLSTTIATETKTEHTSGTLRSAELHLSTTQIPTQQPTTPAAKTDVVSSLSTTTARNQDSTSGTTDTFSFAELNVSTTQVEITSQQTTSPESHTVEVSTKSTTIAMTFQDTTETKPISHPVMKSTQDGAIETTQNHTTAENHNGDINFDTDAPQDCMNECAGKIYPKKKSPSDGSRTAHRASAVVFSLLSLCALLVVGATVYMFVVYTKKKDPAAGGGRLWRKSPRLSILSNSHQDLALGDSVRLKTIEVMVNTPTPEWMFRVHDVTNEDAAQDENATTGDIPSPVVTSDDGRQDGDEMDALYAKPDRMTKNNKNHPSPPSAVAEHSLSVETYDPDFVVCPMFPSAV
ncbi:uncharacterized protein [Asterias amurensis]|uniref:uncharacterized protein n=1 Tax=Asterias amurensis TaxID=7602 RepID=UPI003AB7F347